MRVVYEENGGKGVNWGSLMSDVRACAGDVCNMGKTKAFSVERGRPVGLLCIADGSAFWRDGIDVLRHCRRRPSVWNPHISLHLGEVSARGPLVSPRACFLVKVLSNSPHDPPLAPLYPLPIKFHEVIRPRGLSVIGTDLTGIKPRVAQLPAAGKHEKNGASSQQHMGGIRSKRYIYIIEQNREGKRE